MFLRICKKLFYFFVMLVSVTSNLHANFSIKDWKVWMLSNSEDIITNEPLCQVLRKAEGYAENDKFETAARFIDDAKKCLNSQETIADEPSMLVLDSAELWYKCLSKGKKDRRNISKAEILINKYSKVAENKAFQSYKFLFHRIRDFYHCTGDYAGKIAVQKRMINYDPKDPEQWDSYFEYCRTYPMLKEDAEAFIKELRGKGIITTPPMELSLLYSRFKKGDKNIFGDILVWLDNNRMIDPDNLKFAFSLIDQILDAKDNAMVKDYYYTLTNMALGQKIEGEHGLGLVLILGERDKIKNVMEDIWTNEGRK